MVAVLQKISFQVQLSCKMFSFSVPKYCSSLCASVVSLLLHLVIYDLTSILVLTKYNPTIKDVREELHHDLLG